MNEATAYLQRLLAKHDVQTEADADGWLRAPDHAPACRAIMEEQERPNGARMRLDVEVRLADGRELVESFSDVGTTAEEAALSSWINFSTGTLHVLLGALWGVVYPNEVAIEQWTSGDHRWTLYLGNYVRKAAGGIDVPPPDDLMPAVDRLLKETSFSNDAHWGRVFYANLPGLENGAEVLLDNETWAAGEEAVRGAAWPELASFYSTRLFWMLVPQHDVVPARTPRSRLGRGLKGALKRFTARG